MAEVQTASEQPAAIAESATLVALGDAPVAPETAEASVEPAGNNDNAPQSEGLQSTELGTAETSTQPASETTTEPTGETPAEPIFIEVWRMGRQQFQRRTERPQKRQPRVFNITPRPPKEGADGEQRFRRDRRPAPQTVEAGDGSNTAAAPAERPARPPDQRPRFKGKDDRRRNDRPEDRRSARPSTFSTETRSRDRAPDPDSPFAKLAALKAELEKNKKG
jgi:ATP-dependent RNA helicase SUPV3L1/SUV3